MDGGDDFQSILTKDISSIFKNVFDIFNKIIFQVFSLGVEMGLLSTYRFSVLRLINVWPNFCENEDGFVETSSYKKYF